MWHWVRPILLLVASLRLTPRGELRQQTDHFWLEYIRNLLLNVICRSLLFFSGNRLDAHVRLSVVVDGSVLVVLFVDQ